MVYSNPTTTLDAHREWLAALHQQYDSLSLSASEGAPASPPPAVEQSPFMATRRPSWAAAAAPAPAYYQPAQSYNFYDSMSSLQIDDVEYDDAPVYRSLGGGFDDSPVYTGFGGARVPEMGDSFEGMDAMRAAAASEGPGSVEQLWLSRMPPLLSRQRAFNMELDM